MPAQLGNCLERTDASSKLVHGQFGTTADFPWPEQPGQVNYHIIDLPEIEHLYLQLRYSKASPSTVPILIYIDDETTPRAWLYPADRVWLGHVCFNRTYPHSAASRPVNHTLKNLST